MRRKDTILALVVIGIVILAAVLIYFNENQPKVEIPEPVDQVIEEEKSWHEFCEENPEQCKG